MITIEQNRRSAQIEGNMVRLMITDNKRKGPRLVRQGSCNLPSEADCWCAAAIWVRKGFIDFGEKESQAH